MNRMTRYEMLLHFAQLLGVKPSDVSALTERACLVRAERRRRQGRPGTLGMLRIYQGNLDRVATRLGLSIEWNEYTPVFVSHDQRRIELPDLEATQPDVPVEVGQVSQRFHVVVPAGDYWHSVDGRWQSWRRREEESRVPCGAAHIFQSWLRFLPGFLDVRFSDVAESQLRADVGRVVSNVLDHREDDVRWFLGTLATHLAAGLEVQSDGVPTILSAASNVLLDCPPFQLPELVAATVAKLWPAPPAPPTACESSEEPTDAPSQTS